MTRECLAGWFLDHWRYMDDSHAILHNVWHDEQDLTFAITIT